MEKACMISPVGIISKHSLFALPVLSLEFRSFDFVAETFQFLAWFLRHERKVAGIRMSIGINLCVSIDTVGRVA